MQLRQIHESKGSQTPRMRHYSTYTHLEPIFIQHYIHRHIARLKLSNRNRHSLLLGMADTDTNLLDADALRFFLRMSMQLFSESAKPSHINFKVGGNVPELAAHPSHR